MEGMEGEPQLPRFEWIEVTKGIGITFVILVHSMIPWLNPVTIHLSSFTIAIFFFLAGLTYNNYRYRGNLRYFAISRGKQFLIPYFFLYIIMMVLLFSLVFSTIARQPDLEVAFGSQRLNSQTLQTIAWAMIRLMAALLLCLIVVIIPWSRKRLSALIAFSAAAAGRMVPKIQHQSERIACFLVNILDNIAAGLTLVKHPRRLLACIALTIAIWTITLLSYHVFTLGCPGITLGIVELTTLMVVVCFFIALPSVPGFWGLWEAGGVFALSLFAIPVKEAAGYTLVNHAAQMFPIIIVGWISALITGSNIMQLFNKQRSTSNVEDSAECRSP